MMCLQSILSLIGILLLIQTTTARPTPQQYHLINASLTWYEAQSFCRVKYTDLAAVNNKHSKNKLVSMLGGHATKTWIGLQRGETRRWMWSDGSGSVHFTMWKNKEPNNQLGDEWCAEMSETGLWNDIPCGQEKEFVCYERRQDGTETYVYYSRGMNWVNSQELCRSRHTDLAYVHTEEDNSDIFGLAKTTAAAVSEGRLHKVWIGLFSDAWVWSDGGDGSFRYWLSGTETHGHCAAVSGSQDGRWVGANCNDKATFVCHGGLRVKKTIIRMTFSSDVDLADATVSDALLKKLETLMIHHWVTDFSVSWSNRPTSRAGVGDREKTGR